MGLITHRAGLVRLVAVASPPKTTGPAVSVETTAASTSATVSLALARRLHRTEQAVRDPR
jgi:hypothetical protein